MYSQNKTLVKSVVIYCYEQYTDNAVKELAKQKSVNTVVRGVEATVGLNPLAQWPSVVFAQNQ